MPMSLGLTGMMLGGGNVSGGGVAPVAVYKLVGRSDISYNESTATAGREAIETRAFWKVQADCTVLRFYMVNKYVTSAGVETDASNAADWSVALENAAGTQTVLAPQGVVTLAAGAGRTLIGEIPCSAFSLAKFTKGEVYYWRQRMVVAAAAKQLQFPITGTANAVGETTYRGAAGQTQLGNTGVLSASGVFTYGQALVPFEVTGLSTTHGRAFGCAGTSIPWGQGDNGGLNYGDGGPAGSDGRTTQGGGYVRRAMYALGLPVAMLARQATSALAYTTSSTFRKQSYADIDRLHIEYSTNDFASGAATAAQVKGWTETIISDAKAINPNILCYVQTCLPRVATNGSQVPFSGETARLAFNTIVRANGIVGATDYYDAAAVVESGVTAGTWADDLDNVDGTHPSSQGHGKLATGLQAKLTTWSA